MHRIILLTLLVSTMAVVTPAQADDACKSDCDSECDGVDCLRRYIDDCDVRGGLTCGVDGPCALAQHPTCWTFRMTCYYAGPTLERVDLECQTQPGCCNATHEEGNCMNYGIAVHIVVGTSVCKGEECGNRGILVVVGDYCGAGTRACADSWCVKPCRLEDFACGNRGGPTAVPMPLNADQP